MEGANLPLVLIPSQYCMSSVCTFYHLISSSKQPPLQLANYKNKKDWPHCAGSTRFVSIMAFVVLIFWFLCLKFDFVKSGPAGTPNAPQPFVFSEFLIRN